MKLYTHILTIVSLAVGVLLAQTVSAQQMIPELMNNPEYAELIEKNAELKSRADSLSQYMVEVRAAIRNTPAEDDATRAKLRSDILRMEQEQFVLNSERGDIANRITNIEQEWAIKQITSPIAFDNDIDNLRNTDEDEATGTTHRYLLNNDIFREGLNDEEREELFAVQQSERDIEALVAAYNEKYDAMKGLATAYQEAQNEEEAIPLYDEFMAKSAEADSLDREIDEMWSNILNTKFFIYSYLLEMGKHNTLLNKASERYNEVEQQCSNSEGEYASDALMRYILGRRAMLDYEHSFATTMNLSNAADSLAELRHNARLPEYRLAPVSIEERLFLEYDHILFGRTGHYNSSNPIPELKVYERGTIYRILLGEFRTKQAPTIFKGAQPLFVTRNDDGKYLYYAGGYATLEEAEEAQKLMKEHGFKRPEIFCWEDGTIKELSSEAETKNSGEGDNSTAIVGKRCMVAITTDTLSEELQEIISCTSPGKRVSRAGNKFVVGAFALRSEADSLLAAIKAFDADIEVVINEIEISQDN